MAKTTIAFDPDVEQKLRERIGSEKKTMRKVVNELLRLAFASERISKSKPKPFKVKPISMGFVPGIDPSRLNQLLDEQDVEQFCELDKHGS